MTEKISSNINRIINKVIMLLGYIVIGMISVMPIFYFVQNLHEDTALLILSPFLALSVYLLVSLNGLDNSEDNWLASLSFLFGLASIVGIVGIPTIHILFSK